MTGPENLTRWVWKEFRRAFRWPGISLRGLEEHLEAVVRRGARGVREGLSGLGDEAVEAARRLVAHAQTEVARFLRGRPW